MDNLYEVFHINCYIEAMQLACLSEEHTVTSTLLKAKLSMDLVKGKVWLAHVKFT